MGSPRRSTFVIAALCIFTLLPATKAAQAEIRVTHTDLFANGKLASTFQYTGACPVWLRFDWSLASTDYAGLAYYFQTNDGIRTPRQTASMSPNQGIGAYIDWHVGVNTAKGADHGGWLELHVTNPNVFTNSINFTIHCR